MGQARSFKVTFVSSNTDLAVPSLSQLLSKVRSSPTWDEASIVPEDGDFPRMHVSWLGNSGFTIHCFEDEASAGNFLTKRIEFSEPEVKENLVGQAAELWPPQLFVDEKLAAQAVEHFLNSGKQDPALRWVGTGAFPREEACGGESTKHL